MPLPRGFIRNNVYMDEDSIVNTASPILEKTVAGIYFLINKGKIVYVGQSANCNARIDTHVREGKKVFDSFFINPILDDNERNDAEINNILEFCPKYNKTIPNPLDGSKMFFTKKDIYTYRKEIGNRKIRAYIFSGQIFIKRCDINI